MTKPAPPVLSPYSDLSLVTPDSSLRVVFMWRGDRFVHTVLMGDVESGCSVEGDQDQTWPPSPPLQQLSREQINDSDVILGVGAAGRSHWSVSVELQQLGDRQAIQFDLACRSKSSPTSIGSTYQLSDSLEVIALSEETKITDDHAETNNGRRVVSIQPASTAGDTFRWSYRLQVAKPVADK